MVVCGCLYEKDDGFCVCLLCMCVLWDHICEFALAVPIVDACVAKLLCVCVSECVFVSHCVCL